MRLHYEVEFLNQDHHPRPDRTVSWTAFSSDVLRSQLNSASTKRLSNSPLHSSRRHTPTFVHKSADHVRQCFHYYTTWDAPILNAGTKVAGCFHVSRIHHVTFSSTSLLSVSSNTLVHETAFSFERVKNLQSLISIRAQSNYCPISRWSLIDRPPIDRGSAAHRPRTLRQNYRQLSSLIIQFNACAGWWCLSRATDWLRSRCCYCSSEQLFDRSLPVKVTWL